MEPSPSRQPTEPSRAREELTWQFGRGEVLGLIAFVLLCSALALGTTAARVQGLRVSEDSVESAQPNIPIVATTLLLRFTSLVMHILAVAMYASVSSRAPRPRQQHVYGLTLIFGTLLITLAIASENLEHGGHHAVAWTGYVAQYGAWASYKVILCQMMIKKLAILGSPSSRCQRVEFWGNSMMLWITASGGFGMLGWSLRIVGLLRGVAAEDVLAAANPLPPYPPEELKVSLAEWIAATVLLTCVSISVCVLLVASAAFLITALRLKRGVIAALIARGTAESLLTKVRGVLQRHFVGVALSLSSAIAQLVGNAVDATNMLGHEDVEDLIATSVGVLDAAGDIAGFLLLSGLFEDPKAGDITRQIRSMLYSAVVAGRGDLAFEGDVALTPSRRCIASFPGKYLEEWKALTWLCERRELSSACVFLPLSDPQERFGKHSPCSETPGQCWCEQLYGGTKDWGCLWFDCWRLNIEKAIALDLELIVVFFPGQVGQGVVEWDDLPAEDLWDGNGLGGSQKGEVAYLRKRGIHFVSQDLVTIQSWLRSRRQLRDARNS